jgi:hypothetical protein
MPVIDEMGDFLKTMRVYLLGRGLLSLLVGGAIMTAAVFNIPFTLPALIVAGGGAALSAAMRLYNQASYESRMTDLYRDDIANHLGLAPEQVTRTHLRYAARENEVISQALNRQRRLNIVSFATTALAAATTFGLLSFGLAHEQLGKFFIDTFGEGLLGTGLKVASIGLVSGISSLIVHNGLEEAIGFGSGWNKAVAHDLIVAIDRDVKRGIAVTPEQVYAVLVAENPRLQASIEKQFNEPYHSMKPKEQSAVLARFGLSNDMAEIATFINQKQVPPGRLAYMMQHAKPKSTASQSETAQDAHSPARASFVERMNLAPRAQMHSHREAVLAQRSQAAGAAQGVA